MKEILIVIPARSGSKGIPQKNIRFLCGKPLIYYAVQNALKFRDYFDNVDVYLSSDSEEVEELARIYGCGFIRRSGELSNDSSTVDSVVVDLYRSLGVDYRYIITLQPTSPLLQYETLKKSYESFLKSDDDAVISATTYTHLTWRLEESGYIPNYLERLNRQQLEPIYEETGAYLICKSSNVVKYGTRLHGQIGLSLTPKEESIDIDDKNDWELCERILNRREIALVIEGSKKIGMGHVNRAITLENYFSNDNCIFYVKSDSDLAINKLSKLNYTYVVFNTYQDLATRLINNNVNMVVNDVLDADCDYLNRLKSKGIFVVGFEDDSHCNKSDLVFNALYEFTRDVNGIYYGYSYEILREDVYLFPYGKSKFDQSGKLTVMISFGGTDVNNLSQDMLGRLQKYGQELNIILVLGVGAITKSELYNNIQHLDFESLTIVQDVGLMAPYIDRADFIISGNGRMVHEVVAMAKPLLVISQNAREHGHTFASRCPGVVYLGQFGDIDYALMDRTIEGFMKDREKLSSCSSELLPFAKEIRGGLRKVGKIINEAYYL